MCLSFTFNFPSHLVLIVLITAYLYSLFIKNTFCCEEWEESLYNEITIPLNMFFFMTCRSYRLSFLFHKDTCFVLHITEVSGVGSNISLYLLALPSADRAVSFSVHLLWPSATRAQQTGLESQTDPLWWWCMQSSSSSLVLTGMVSPSWIKKEERLGLVGLAETGKKASWPV